MKFLSSLLTANLQVMILYGVLWLVLRPKTMRMKWARTLRVMADRLEVSRARPIRVFTYLAVLVALAAIGTALN